MQLPLLASTFVTVFLAELGDKTQLAIVTISGTSSRSGAVFAGSAAALVLGGRLVAPVATARPDGMEEIARDADQWVAQKVAAFDAAALVIPRRAAPRTGHQ